MLSNFAADKEQNELTARSATPCSTGAKPFLRRGSGLARYGGISGSPKGVVRRKSNSHASPYSQLKRSTSSSAITQPKSDTKEKTKPTTSDNRIMKTSKSCSKISNCASKLNSKSPTRSLNKAESHVRRPSKILKLKSVKQSSQGKISPKFDLDVINSNSEEVCTNVKQQTKVDRGFENMRPRTYNKNDFEQYQGGDENSNSIKEPVTAHRTVTSTAAISAYDSVELSFMEKLDKANKRHSRELEDLATFEMLEDRLATNDSSICSSISALKINSKQKQEEKTKADNDSPKISPVFSRHPFADAASATSTPLSNKVTMEKIKNKPSSNLRGTEIYRRQLEDSVILEEHDPINELQKNSFKSDDILKDPVVNHNLMQDIKNFLESNNDAKVNEHIKVCEPKSNSHDTEEDDTLKDDAIDGIPSDEDDHDRKLYEHCLNGQSKHTNDIYDVNNDQFSDSSIENDYKNAKNVRFREKVAKKNYEALTFSPPRIPKSSPSYLIWSIFTKEREERNRKKSAKLKAELEEDEEWLDLDENEDKNGKIENNCPKDTQTQRDMLREITNTKTIKSKNHIRRRRRSESPLSRISSKNKINDINDDAFCDTLFNAKLVELNKEVETFKKENTNLQTSRRRLNADKKQLAKDIEEFERNKENEKKKLEEERKRLRREKAMFEKSQKERKINNDRKSQDDIEELQMKLQKLNDELNRKETKWALALSKLQEQVKFLERENQQLHEENHKLKLKGVSAKVSSHLVDPSTRRIYSASNSVQGFNSPMSSSKASSNQLFYNSGKAPSEISKCHSVESGMRPESISSASPMHSNNIDVESVVYKPTENDNNGDDLEASRLMAFSPAESLESNVTLVSAGISDPSSRAMSDSKTAKVANTIGSSTVDRDNGTRDIKRKSLQKYDYNGLKDENEVKKVDKVEKSSDKVVKYYSDGSVEICCANGHRKEISPDGKNTKVYYNNGDIKETLPNGLVKYFYSGVKTWHFKYQDGREVTQFNNGKTETKFPDGTVVIDEANGDSIILLPNGQKEEHTSQYKVK